MRIAHITATFPPYHGGTGNVCFHHARELARRGHDMHVFTATHPGPERHEHHAGITIHRLRPWLRFGNAALLPGLLLALRQFDLIHLHYPFFGGELATLAARQFRIPLIITYHQDVLLPGALGVVERVLRGTSVRWTLRSANRLLFTSADYGDESYVRPLLRGREPRVCVVPNGVDTTTFAPGPDAIELRFRHDLRTDDQIALVVAGLDRAHYFKGVEVFLRALARCAPATTGIIVGDGDLRGRYEALAAQLGISQRIIFAGRIADERLPAYYRLADLTVLPSITMGEAFGLVLVESLACGTPVIATNLPGVRAVIRDTDGGRIVAPNDAAALAATIEQLLGDPAARQAMSERGRRAVTARYDWAAIGKQLETIYQQALAEAAIHRHPYAGGAR